MISYLRMRRCLLPAALGAIGSLSAQTASADCAYSKSCVCDAQLGTTSTGAGSVITGAPCTDDRSAIVVGAELLAYYHPDQPNRSGGVVNSLAAARGRAAIHTVRSASRRALPKPNRSAATRPCSTAIFPGSWHGGRSSTLARGTGSRARTPLCYSMLNVAMRLSQCRQRRLATTLRAVRSRLARARMAVRRQDSGCSPCALARGVCTARESA